MSTFTGFPSTDQDSVPVPAVFFSDILPLIEDLGELRVVLYAFWIMNAQAKEPRFLRFSDMTGDKVLMSMFGVNGEEQESNLHEALTLACQHAILVDASHGDDMIYFLNSARGRAARDGLAAGKWNPDVGDRLPIHLTPERPNIFTLYEQNIGPLTPILSDTLQDAERSYPVEWISEAIEIAVKKNVRNWRFIDAILKSWKEKGRDEADRRASKEDRKRDSEGKYADYINR